MRIQNYMITNFHNNKEEKKELLNVIKIRFVNTSNAIIIKIPKNVQLSIILRKIKKNNQKQSFMHEKTFTSLHFTSLFTSLRFLHFFFFSFFPVVATKRLK